jgi:acetyl-CoA carboxylase biotin carboxyl carrier protein
MMNLKELKELIEIVSEKGFAEFEIERQGFRLRISNFVGIPGGVRMASSEGLGPSEDKIGGQARMHYEPGETDGVLPAARTWPESASASRAAARPPQSAEPALHVIKSPIVGTFYRSSSPTSEPFVKVGDSIGPDSVVCIIEAMKLMNEIQADISGEVVQIFVENGQAVEYDQPLFGIRT